MSSTHIFRDTVTGYVYGQVIKPGTHSPDWIALVNGKNLGRFTDPQAAQKQVEQHANQYAY